MKPLFLVVLLFAAGCNFGLGNTASTPRFGRWTVTAITGSFTHVDSGAACVGNWTYSVPNLGSTWNGVRVGSSGDLQYFLEFKGVAGSPEPDSYQHGAPATGKSGSITGNDSRPDLGSVTTANGNYDEKTMTINWTSEQHLGSTSAFKTDVSGSGTLTATPP